MKKAPSFLKSEKSRQVFITCQFSGRFIPCMSEFTPKMLRSGSYSNLLVISKVSAPDLAQKAHFLGHEKL